MKAYREYIDTKKVFTVNHEPNSFNPSNETKQQIFKIVRS